MALNLERKNYTRLLRLLLDVGTSVYRDVFKSRYPNRTDYSYIFKPLENKPKLFNNSQKRVLFPEGGYSGDLSDLDISVLYLLLRHIGNIPPHNKKWGNDPDDTDESLAAYIERLRIFRNQSFAHETRAAIAENEFPKKWEFLKKILIKLGAQENTIDELLISPIDSDIEEEYERKLADVRKQEEDNANKLIYLDYKIEKVEERVTKIEQSGVQNVPEANKANRCEFAVNNIHGLQCIIRELLHTTDLKNVTDYFCSEGLLDFDDASLIDNIYTDNNQTRDLLVSKLSPRLVDMSILHDTMQTFCSGCEVILGSIEYFDSDYCPFTIMDNIVQTTGCRIVLQVFVALGMVDRGEVDFLQCSCDHNGMHGLITKVTHDIRQNCSRLKSLDIFQTVCDNVIYAVEQYAEQETITTRRWSDTEGLGNILNTVLQSLETTTQIQYLLRTCHAVGWLAKCDLGMVFQPKLQNQLLCKLIPHLVNAKPVRTYLEELKKNEDLYIKERNSCRNKILGHWKYLKENLETRTILPRLHDHKFLNQDDVFFLQNKTRVDCVYFVLTRVIRKIEKADDYRLFLEILTQFNEMAALRLETDYVNPGWDKKVQGGLDCRYKLETNRKLLEAELKPHEILDDFLEGFVFDIDDHEEVWAAYKTRREMAKRLVDRAIATVEKGSYSCLLHAIKRTMSDVICGKIARKLETTIPAIEFVEAQNAVTVLHEQLIIHRDAKSGPIVKKCRMKISINAENKDNIENKVKEYFPEIQKWIVPTLFACVKEIYRGSVIVRLLSLYGDLKSNMENSIRNGMFSALFDKLFENKEIQETFNPGEYTVEVSIEDDTEQVVEIQGYEHVNAEFPSNLITANRSFLREEIDPLSLIPAFEKKGFTCFENLNLTKIESRKLRADKFLDVIEADNVNMLGVFFDILEEEKMEFVLEHLRLAEKFLTTDPSLLRKNIMKNLLKVLENLDLNDMRDVLVEREIITNGFLQQLDETHDTDNRTEKNISIITEILQYGDNAIFSIITSLHMKNKDSLVEDLLRGTQRSLSLDGANIQELDLLSLLTFDREEYIVKNYQSEEDRKGLMFNGIFKVQVKQPEPHCIIKTILLLDVGASMGGSRGILQLKTTVFDYLAAQDVTSTDYGLEEHIATITFGSTAELKHHFRSKCNIVKHFIRYLPSPVGPSRIIDGLQRCKTLLTEMESDDMRVNMSRKPTFNPRIILVSDGRFVPETFHKTDSVDNSSQVDPELIEICTFFKKKKVEINCVPVGNYDRVSIDQIVEFREGFPTDPLHFLAKKTGGKIVFAEQVEKLGNERYNKLNKYIVDELKGIMEPSTLLKVAMEAVKNNITNVYKVMGMARDAGIAEVCPSALAGLLHQLRNMNKGDDDSDETDDELD